jgi:molybdopterin/thiamine biosynthesis adenylyltransferase
MRHVVIGAGGIGRWLILGLTPTLTESDELVVVDGDTYEPRNLTRQGATQGNKADWMARQVSGYRCRVSAIPAFVTANVKDGTAPVDEVIEEGDVVWCAVDNHATRKLVINHCATLKDVRLVSGGCDDDEGNVIVYERKDGEDVLTHPFVRHPELKRAKTWKKPTPVEHQASCAARSDDGSGQTIRANMMAAVCMMGAVGDTQEVYFNTYPVATRVITNPFLKDAKVAA